MVNGSGSTKGAMYLRVVLILVSISAQTSDALISSRQISTRRRITGSLPRNAHHDFRQSTAAAESKATTPIFSREELDDFARSQGLEITLSTLGPGFRSTARSLQNRTEIMGYVEGFSRGKILHLDKMEVFSKAVKSARQNNPQFTGGGTILGVGLLMGYVCLLHGKAAGCQTAEFLAIDDEDYQHKRLVRYYTTAGMDIVKYVGDDFRDIPDRMVWGGCGTLLRKDIGSLMTFWSSILSRSVEKNKAKSLGKP